MNDVQIRIVPLVTESVLGIVGIARLSKDNQVISISFAEKYRPVLGGHYHMWDFQYEKLPQPHILMRLRPGDWTANAKVT